jgi:hypothetical protein
MRENRQSGSEGGAGLYTLFLPLSNGGPGLAVSGASGRTCVIQSREL